MCDGSYWCATLPFMTATTMHCYCFEPRLSQCSAKSYGFALHCIGISILTPSDTPMRARPFSTNFWMWLPSLAAVCVCVCVHMQCTYIRWAPCGTHGSDGYLMTLTLDFEIAP